MQVQNNKEEVPFAHYEENSPRSTRRKQPCAAVSRLKAAGSL